MTRKRMSPATKHKLQLILIYLAAIVFCILWLSDEIAISRQIKRDDMRLLSVAARASESLDLYASSDDNETFWNESVGSMEHFAAVYNDIAGTRLEKKFSKKGWKRYKVGDYAGGIADIMIAAPDIVKPYIPDFASAMRDFLDYLKGADVEHAVRAEEELGRILEEVHFKYYSDDK